jgi:hypothetical protein
MARQRSKYGNATGPHPVLLAGAAIGLGLLGYGFTHLSVHILWQAPLGLWLVIGCFGKMAAR